MPTFFKDSEDDQNHFRTVSKTSWHYECKKAIPEKLCPLWLPFLPVFSLHFSGLFVITFLRSRVNSSQLVRSYDIVYFSLQFVALYDYDPFKSSPNPNPASELSFKEGDILRVFDTSRKDGFFVGKVRMSTASCLEVLLE